MGRAGPGRAGSKAKRAGPKKRPVFSSIVYATRVILVLNMLMIADSARTPRTIVLIQDECLLWEAYWPVYLLYWILMFLNFRKILVFFAKH